MSNLAGLGCKCYSLVSCLLSLFRTLSKFSGTSGVLGGGVKYRIGCSPTLLEDHRFLPKSRREGKGMEVRR